MVLINDLSFAFSVYRALSHILLSLSSFITVLRVGHFNLTPVMNKVRTKSVKMRKQVNPRDICECTLAKDQHSISEEEAK